MSEMGQNVMGASFSVPAAQDFNTLGFQGSMQQVLQENVGSYVVVEFLMVRSLKLLKLAALLVVVSLRKI